jgi:hypothetical protein
MHKIKPGFLLFFLLLVNIVDAQELNARVTVNSSQIGTSVNKKVFQGLQTALTTFLNTRKWTKDKFLINEKIDCNFLLILQPTKEENVYTAQLTIQAARPIYNSSYLSPIVSFRDDDIIFKYLEFQQLEFNENRISGPEPLVSNLTAVFAYYAYLVIAFDYDSFSLRGGVPYFQKAQNIVNNAPETRGILGWKGVDGRRNRYWLTQNMQNNAYAIMHDVYYDYYRKAGDKMFEDQDAARLEMLNVLNLLNNFNTENNNTMILAFFFQGKTNELIKSFSKAPPQERARASELLQKIDITNSARYKEELR